MNDYSKKTLKQIRPSQKYKDLPLAKSKFRKAYLIEMLKMNKKIKNMNI